jgi:hypothetical protein
MGSGVHPRSAASGSTTDPSGAVVADGDDVPGEGVLSVGDGFGVGGKMRELTMSATIPAISTMPPTIAHANPRRPAP